MVLSLQLSVNRIHLTPHSGNTCVEMKRLCISVWFLSPTTNPSQPSPPEISFLTQPLCKRGAHFNLKADICGSNASSKWVQQGWSTGSVHARSWGKESARERGRREEGSAVKTREEEERGLAQKKRWQKKREKGFHDLGSYLSIWSGVALSPSRSKRERLREGRVEKL